MYFARPKSARSGNELESVGSGLGGAPRFLFSILCLGLCTCLADGAKIEGVEGRDGPLRTSAPVSKQVESANPQSRSLLSKSEYLGLAVCVGCHTIEAEHWADTIHAAVFLRNPRTTLERRGCEACHGPGSDHLKDPTDRSKIVAFTRDGDRSSSELNAVCLQCHAGDARIHWAGSAHESENLACSDCHNPMSKISASDLLREASVKRTCFACHPAQRVEFRKRSHMPLFEGKIDCHDCHQSHGSVTDPLLRANSTFELCTNCHSDKRGPFIWEHAPVTEGCTSCHLPHGSNRDSLLVTSPPFLCQQCHAQLGLQNHPIELLTRENLGSAAVARNRDPRIVGRGCVNCHIQIHGSNHPSGARFHR